MNKQIKLDLSYLRMAQIWAQNSYCKKDKVGALVVKNNSIIGDGFNGTPSGFPNICEDEIDENLVTRKDVLHAETNAISKIAKSTNSSFGSTMYITREPCVNCAKLMIQCGIVRVVIYSGYKSTHTKGIELLQNNGVKVIEYQKEKLSFKI